MILVRATTLSSHVIELAEQLAQFSGLSVCFLLDGRHPLLVETGHPKIMVSLEACRALKLYCPADFHWRCGDYGVYLARARFPAVKHFWLIEHDVRLAGGEVGGVFALFERHPEVDFLTTNYRPAAKDWYWFRSAAGKNIQAFKCLFTIVRLSARAIDHLLQKRQKQSRHALRRTSWPNDEAFVATTLGNAPANYLVRDINSFGRDLYSDETLSVTRKIRGEDFEPLTTRTRIYHPVLFGEHYTRGNTTSAVRNLPSAWERILRRLNRYIEW